MRFRSLLVNHDAFKVIDSPQKAYLLGLLLADGCVREPTRRSRYRVNLRIKSEDAQACRMVQELAGGSLRLIEGGYRAAWEASSDGIALDLIRHGVTPRKTFSAALRWDLVPHSLHGAVLAGLIDGDGHLRFSKAARRAELTIVTASAALRDQLLERFWFFRATEVLPKNPKHHLLYRVEVGTNRDRLNAMIQTIYADLSVPILPRKQAVLDKLRTYLAEMDAYDARMATIPALKASGMTIREIAKVMGTSLRPVRARLEAQGIQSRIGTFSDWDRDEMRRLHGQGRTVLEIHRALGKGTEQAVRYHLQRLGCVSKRSMPGISLRHGDADAIVAEYRRGKAANAIAADRRMCPRVVCRILREAGVELVRGAVQKLTWEKVAWADQELERGRSLRAVATDLGVSETLIRAWQRRRAIESVEGGDSGCGHEHAAEPPIHPIEHE